MIKAKTGVILALCGLLLGFGGCLLLMHFTQDVEALERLREENAALKLKEEELQAQLATNLQEWEEAKTVHESVLSEERAARAKREKDLLRQLASSRAHIRRLQEERDALASRLEGMIEELPTLTDEQLAPKALGVVVGAFPDRAQPTLVPVRPNFFEANRPLVETTMLGMEELTGLRDQMQEARGAITSLNGLVENQKLDLESWETENQKLGDRCLTCEAALQTSKQLEDTMGQRLQVQHEMVEKLEKKLWWRRLEQVGTSAAAGFLGYEIGKRSR